MTLDDPIEIAKPQHRPPVVEPLMRTSLELIDRAIEIEWATTLKHKAKSTVDHALGLLVAEWAAIWGPWSCFRILRIAFHAVLHPVWRSRAKRGTKRMPSGKKAT